MEKEELENVNPRIFEKLPPRSSGNIKNSDYDPVDSREIFDLICTIRDPEHPMTLEELGVVNLKNIKVDDEKSMVMINYTPTIPHCSMATLIGLSIRVKLIRSLASRFKVTVEITPGTHTSEHAINKQLADKERVAAAIENKHLCGVIDQCISFHNENTKNVSNKTDIDKIVRKHVYGETFEMLEKLNTEVEKIGKFDFLKDSEPELYKNYMFLEKLTKDIQDSEKDKDVLKPKVIKPEDILAELEYLSSC